MPYWLTGAPMSDSAKRRRLERFWLAMDRSTPNNYVMHTYTHSLISSNERRHKNHSRRNTICFVSVTQHKVHRDMTIYVAHAWKCSLLCTLVCGPVTLFVQEFTRISMRAVAYIFNTFVLVNIWIPMRACLRLEPLSE